MVCFTCQKITRIYHEWECSMELPFQLDFVSLVVGYIIGAMMVNSVRDLIFQENN